MSIRAKKRLIRRKYVHTKLKRRLLIFIVMFLAMCGIMIYDLALQKISFVLAIIAFLLGIFLGYSVGSIHKIKWHETDSMVIAKMDKTGIIILIIYIAFSISRRWIFGHWVHGESLSAFSFTFAAGVIYGRFMTTRIKIRKILKEQKFIVK